MGMQGTTIRRALRSYCHWIRSNLLLSVAALVVFIAAVEMVVNGNYDDRCTPVRLLDSRGVVWTIDALMLATFLMLLSPTVSWEHLPCLTALSTVVFYVVLMSPGDHVCVLNVDGIASMPLRMVHWLFSTPTVLFHMDAVGNPDNERASATMQVRKELRRALLANWAMLLLG
jgi:hypothetical protein